MEITTITYPIRIIRKAIIDKNIFEGIEIYPSVFFSTVCPKCLHSNKITIELNNGHLLEDLYLKSNIISKSDIIKNGIAKENHKIYAYLGELMIFPNVPVYHTFLLCPKCCSHFMLVYGYGEVQPGRDVCIVSGLWQIEEKIND